MVTMPTSVYVKRAWVPSWLWSLLSCWEAEIDSHGNAWNFERLWDHRVAVPPIITAWLGRPGETFKPGFEVQCPECGQCGDPEQKYGYCPSCVEYLTKAVLRAGKPAMAPAPERPKKSGRQRGSRAWTKRRADSRI